MELKEAEEKSLKEFERLEKEVAEIKEMKVNIDFIIFNKKNHPFSMSLSPFWFVCQLNRKRLVP